MVRAPGGVGDGLRLAAGEHVEDPLGGGLEGRRGGPAAQPHQVRGEDDVGVAEERMPGWRFRVEHVEADAGQPSRGEGAPHRVGVEEPAAAAVDQDGARLHPGQEGVADQLAGLVVQRQVQGDDVAAGGEVVQARAAHAVGRLAERVVGQHPHPERRAERRGPPADPAVADDPEGGAVEVPDADPAAFGPAALADQRGERPEPLDQVQRHADRSLGHGGDARPGGDHHGDPPGRRGRHVNQVGAHAGPGEDPEPGGPAEQLLVDPGVGPDDGARGGGDIGVTRRGDEPAAPVEDPRDQRRVDGSQRHHHRQSLAGRHQGCPKVAPGTGATLCQAPSWAEAAVAAMTSASACASSIVELRRSPPAAATRNFFASMTFRSS